MNFYVRHLQKAFILSLLFVVVCKTQTKTDLKINDLDYFEKPGLNVLVFSNYYGLFNDEKLSSVEFIHHGVRTVTNGDVRLNPTPEQWDPNPVFKERKINKEDNSIEAYLSYPVYNFNYSIKVESRSGGILLSVNLDKPLPKELENRAGLNLEFLPSAYFEKSYLADNKAGIFPLYPAGPMEKSANGVVEPKPLASGKTIVFAPGDSLSMITVQSQDGELSLYDGRNKAQNGWFVVRSLIPAGKSGKVVEWFITASTITDWLRKPVIQYSQVGYHPKQKKTAVIEFDKNDKPNGYARLLKINYSGNYEEKFKAEIKSWGNYLRYNYFTFDFSEVREDGIYVIEYNNISTSTFRISENVYEDAWHPTSDIYLPVQMDHMLVNEAYRIWHGASHLDDALQAPVNHEHFDLYAQGPQTDTPYKPGEHIPGLNIGGWFDAGDYDIRTQTQYSAVLNLVHTWESFKPERDETTIDQRTRFVDMHHPDGKPDILQQIEHGTLGLISQFRAVGHAIPGIVEAHLSQYTHLGDAVTKTDNLIYNPKLDSLQSDGFTCGTFDDRWAFTSENSALNYGSIAAIAAASRVLRGYNDSLANECFNTAVEVWDDEHSHPPVIFTHGNTTGGPLDAEELRAAVELLICTKDPKYSGRVNELLDTMKERFNFNASVFARAIPFMDKLYSDKVEKLVINYKQGIEKITELNPYGVPVTTGGWAGNGAVVGFASNNYVLHKAFPNIINAEYVLKGLNYIYGCHPGSNISLVSGVGTVSKKIAYGNNRADFSFIAGGVVPGILIIKPDFPENKEDWPFLWGENEYVVNLGVSYIYLVNAVNDLLNEK